MTHQNQTSKLTAEVPAQSLKAKPGPASGPRCCAVCGEWPAMVTPLGLRCHPCVCRDYAAAHPVPLPENPEMLRDLASIGVQTAAEKLSRIPKPHDALTPTEAKCRDGVVLQRLVPRQCKDATKDKIRKALTGHKHSHETKAKLRAATLKQHADGRVGKMSPEALAKQTERMKQYIRSGKIDPHRPCPESVKEKLRAHKLSPEHIESLRLHARQQAKEGRINTAGLKMGPPIGLPKAWAVCRGSHAFGRVERGRLDHANACAWRVRSPVGIEYQFTNAMEWCRRNESLFLDRYPHSKLPLWMRAARGFSSLAANHGKACSWHGWTLVASSEIRDYLQRHPLPNSTTKYLPLKNPLSPAE